MRLLERALASGEIAPGIDIEVLADALWGPIFHRLLVSRAPIDRAFIDKLLGLVLSGARAGTGQGAAYSSAKEGSQSKA
jgi:hypothetical protein